MTSGDFTTRKRVAWALLAGCVGATLLFALLCVTNGPPAGREKGLYLWPACTVIGAALAWRHLRWCYQMEPGRPLGLWQLTMSDLLVVSFFTGSMFAVFRALAPAWFVLVGVPMSLLTAGAFLGGLLLGARKGIRPAAWKYSFALAFTVRLYGMLGIGALVVLMIAGLFYRVSPYEVLRDFVFSDTPRRDWVCYAFRAALVCLPLGLWGCHWVEKKLPAAAPPNKSDFQAEP